MELDLLVLGPPFIPLAFGVLNLIVPYLNPVRKRAHADDLRQPATIQNGAQRWLAFAAMLLAWGSSLALLLLVFDGKPLAYHLGGWDAPYGIVLVADRLSALFTFMATTVMLTGFIYTLHARDKCMNFPAFMPLFLWMATGLHGAFLTGDLFSFFVFMELLVLSSVPLVAMSDDRFGLEAAIKYLFISGMGTVFLLMGIAAIYATFGTLNLADIAQNFANVAERPLLAQISAIMLMCAFLLKSAVFPFHFWQPDFHTTAPTPVSAMLSSVVVKVGIYGLIRMTTLLFIAEAPLIQQWLIVLGLLGIVFGSLSALGTYNGKRMLAYSTIGQIGFILVAIGWGHPLALVAAIVYAFNHALIKSALLMLMGAVASRVKPKSANFADINGIGPKLPFALGAMWFLGGMSLAGIPPMNGFISKLAVVQGGVAAQDWLPLVLAIGAGLLTLIYMSRSWQTIFQAKKEPVSESEAPLVKIKKQGDAYLAPLLLIGACVLLGFFAVPLVEFAHMTVNELSDPSIYIEAVNLVPLEG